MQDDVGQGNTMTATLFTRITLATMAVVSLTATGCDLLEGDGIGPDGGIVVSEDGRMALEIPAGALDMISSIFLARELVRTQGPAVDFPLLDKDGWWDLTMVLGDRAQIKVPAGTFACQAVKLDPKPPANSDNRKEFKGLFGIHGTLSIWLHEGTGVPVKIEGIVPLGPLNLDVAIVLANFTDTEKAFAPMGQENQ